MAKKGAKKAKVTRVSPLKPGLRGASRLVQSRVHAGLRAATLSRTSMARFLGSILLAFLALAFLALWLGGHLGTIRDGVNDFKRDRLMAMGFVVERIDVTGEGRLHEADVRAAVGIYEGDYFFGADLKRAQENTQSLPWVDRAVVRRLWPNRIVVQLVETTPYALFQKDGTLFLANREGQIIAPYDARDPALPSDLKLYIGTDAIAQSEGLQASMQRYPALWSNAETLTRYPSGRWDVTFHDGVVLKLPPDNVDTALRHFQQLIRRTDVGQFSIVDMRLPDRLTLTPARTVTA
jgi:cell division protein FtsQ